MCLKPRNDLLEAHLPFTFLLYLKNAIFRNSIGWMLPKCSLVSILSNSLSIYMNLCYSHYSEKHFKIDKAVSITAKIVWKVWNMDKYMLFTTIFIGRTQKSVILVTLEKCSVKKFPRKLLKDIRRLWDCGKLLAHFSETLLIFLENLFF